MKINHQFGLMLMAFILIPILVLGFTLGSRLFYADSAQSVPVYAEITQYLGSVDAAEWQNLQNFLTHRPADIDVVIFNSAYTVAFSSVRDFQVGAKIAPIALSNYILDQTTRYSFNIDRPPELKGAFILGRFPHKPMPPGGIIRILGDTTLFLVILLFVVSLGISLVARNITHSIMRLEKATHRVASGDLEYSIQAAGNNEIRSLAASIEQMRLALREELARRGRFVMGISHDLKSPLALARAYVEAIHDGVYDNDAEKERYFSITITKLDQLDGLIDDMIDFVRLENGSWQAKLETIRLKAFLENFARGMAHDAEVFSKRFHTELEISDQLAVQMDARLIQRSLENLVGNALRHSGVGSQVSLRASAQGQEILVEVWDNGQGISPEILSRVFEPFYRASASRQEPGMGIGLPTVKTLVEAHGWSVTARSFPGETVFTIHIPRIANPDPSV